MLSPAGITTYQEDFDFYPEFVERFKRQKRTRIPPRWGVKCCMCCFGSVWKCKCSPFAIMRCCGRCCANTLMKGYIKNRFATVPPAEMEDYKVYLQQSLMKSASTEYAIFLSFNHLLQAFHPLDRDDRLNTIPIPVSFYFGDRDWMLTDAGHKIVEKNPYKGLHSNVFIIEDSDHHLYFDNPTGFVEAIFKDLENAASITKVASARV